MYMNTPNPLILYVCPVCLARMYVFATGESLNSTVVCHGNSNCFISCCLFCQSLHAIVLHTYMEIINVDKMMIKDKNRVMSYMIKDKKLGCEN